MAKLFWDIKTQQFIDLEDVNNLDYASKKYKLSSNKKEVGEGDTVDITLHTVNVPEGTSVPFKIFISGEDTPKSITQDLFGNFTVGSLDSAFESSSVLTFNTIADNLTDGKRFMTLYLKDFPDESVEIALLDTSETPASSLPSYSLSSNVDPTGELPEGSNLVLTLDTSNVPNGVVAYSMSGGISEDDILTEKLKGYFTVSNDAFGNSSSNVTINFKEDFKTDGDELVKVELVGLSESLSFIVKDTSKSPTFNLSVDKKEVSSNESIKITLETTNTSDGSIIPFIMRNIKSSDVLVDSQSPLDSEGDIVDSSGDLILSKGTKSLRGNFIVNGNKSEREIQISDLSYLKNPRKLVTVELLTGEKVNFNLKK